MGPESEENECPWMSAWMTFTITLVSNGPLVNSWHLQKHHLVSLVSWIQGENVVSGLVWKVWKVSLLWTFTTFVHQSKSSNKYSSLHHQLLAAIFVCIKLPLKVFNIYRSFCERIIISAYYWVLEVTWLGTQVTMNKALSSSLIQYKTGVVLTCVGHKSRSH